VKVLGSSPRGGSEEKWQPNTADEQVKF
jgi:hypothetical protein